MKIELQHIPLPDMDVTDESPAITAEEHDARMNALYERANCDWVAVYGDREHCANLAYLTGYDPRFEEALLVLGPDKRRCLVVGNEGLAYAAAGRAGASRACCASR